MENSARRGRHRSRLPAHVHHQRVEEKKDLLLLLKYSNLELRLGKEKKQKVK
jgi:hypothetical protein